MSYIIIKQGKRKLKYVLALTKLTDGGINLFGRYLYFEDIDEEKKEIPPNVVDKRGKIN